MKTKQTNNKNKKRAGKILVIFSLFLVTILSLQFFIGGNVPNNKTFCENTKINGLDVGNMTAAEAENVVLTNMLESKKDIEIELESRGKSWILEGADFDVCNKLQPIMAKLVKMKKQGDFTLSYTNILSNLNEKLDEIIVQVEQDEKPASLVFNAESDGVFEVDGGQNTIIVDREKLYNQLESELAIRKKVKIEIPIIETEQNIDIEALKNSVGLRSSFSTNYEKSSKDRKSNIKNALSKFNGMIVQPGQVVSFNQTTGERTIENGYNNAHILVGGKYIDGVGGGVCQASTTLYNALLLADIDVLSVNHHTIPASYVPLSFDAMVSGDYADLVFQNNFDNPIYIKTKADDKNVTVEIYGQKLEEGLQIKRRAELVKVLPHNGDRIVADVNGEHINKIIYKGEYLRERYPREGYESKAYLQYYKDGKLVKEKEIRHDFYPAQDGVVFEGVEDAEYGMTIPASDVKIISPQKVTKQTEESVKAKLSKTNPEEYNP